MSFHRTYDQIKGRARLRISKILQTHPTPFIISLIYEIFALFYAEIHDIKAREFYILPNNMNARAFLSLTEPRK